MQKVLELSVITAIGSALQNKLDSKAVSALLLNGLVPAVIVNSLSSIKASAGLGGRHTRRVQKYIASLPVTSNCIKL
jgi:hypothetical protein